MCIRAMHGMKMEGPLKVGHSEEQRYSALELHATEGFLERKSASGYV